MSTSSLSPEQGRGPDYFPFDIPEMNDDHLYRDPE